MVSTTVKGMNYVGGQWVDAQSGATFEDRSPADVRDLLGTFPRSGADDAARAVAAAREAYPQWRRTSLLRRAEVLDRFAQLVKEDTEELARPPGP